MTNLIKISTFLLLFILVSCNKETDALPLETDNTQYIYDWATGENILTLSDGDAQSLADRSPDNYLYNVVSATSSYQQKITIYENNVLIYAGPWTVTTGTGFGFSGDNSNEYKFVVNYKRKVPSISVNVSINWNSNCEGTSATESFNIGTNGITKTHIFLACE